MAYLTEEIELKARELTGMTENDAALKTVCELAAEEAASRLRSGIAPEDIGAGFTSAAALIAAADLFEMRDKGAGGISSFSAGNISASFGSLRPEPAELRRRAWLMLAKYTETGSFGFMGVRG